MFHVRLGKTWHLTKFKSINSLQGSIDFRHRYGNRILAHKNCQTLKSECATNCVVALSVWAWHNTVNPQTSVLSDIWHPNIAEDFEESFIRQRPFESIECVHAHTSTFVNRNKIMQWEQVIASHFPAIIYLACFPIIPKLFHDQLCMSLHGHMLHENQTISIFISFFANVWLCKNLK